jgi:glycosyltransferase involved in cell wall biosynthesis
MKVFLYFRSFAGGVQRGQVVLANELSAHGLEVTVVMPKARGAFLEMLAPEVRLVDLGASRPLLAVIGLARLLRRSRPHALIASQTSGVNVAVMARAIGAVDVAIIAVQHNVLSKVCRQSDSWRMRTVMPMLVRLFYPMADRVVSVSRGAADDLASMTGLPDDDIAVVPNMPLPADVAALSELPTGCPWLDHKEVPVILAVGGLRPVKDHEMLLEAFALVRRMRPARLVILGRGDASRRKRLDALARQLQVQDDVLFAGHQPNPFAYMARADVFALSSRHEGFSNVLVEALACGCPIVSTDCPYGPREILERGLYGQLVPVGDHHEMASAIATMLSGGLRFSREMLQRRAAEFSVDVLVGRYLSLLRSAGNDCPIPSHVAG